MYSSIEEEARKEVLEKCYWNIFTLVEAGIPIGLEASGVTLEIINKLDHKWIQKLKEYIKKEKIEFIGSGYSQIIGPLVPAKVNSWNQKLGLEVYNNLLDMTPNIALVNEMAYSGGIVEHYLDNQYEAIMMEWNNPRKYHPEWENELRYFPQRAVGTDERSIPLIWTDSIAFQKFQRYAHAEYELSEYIDYLKNHTITQDNFFPLYSNDLEIFNYRPNRYHTEVQKGIQPEFERILRLYNFLKNKNWAELIFPSEVLNGLSRPYGGNDIHLESPEQPIPVKKQEKYNINRWALTGRDDININTKCFQIYQGLVDAKNKEPDNWKSLCYLWSSDFRTHVTDKRWFNFQKRLNKVVKQFYSASMGKEKINNKEISKGSYFLISETNRLITIENSKLKIVLNKQKGLSIKKYFINNISDTFLIGTLDHGYFDDISLSADYYSGHAVIERPTMHKITDLEKVNPEIHQINKQVIIKTEQQCDHVQFSTKIVVSDKSYYINKSIQFNSRNLFIIRPIIFTFNPEAWDKKTLFIETHNGGEKPEKFLLANKQILHNDIYSPLISARHGFGHTRGLLSVGDKSKKMTFYCNMITSALIPTVVFLPQENNKFFLRIQYSAKEIDDTSKIPILKNRSISYTSSVSITSLET